MESDERRKRNCSANRAKTYNQRPRPYQPPPPTSNNMTMMIRRVVLSIIASCHLPRSASLTPPMAFRTLPLTWSPLPSLWSLRSPVSFPATSFTLPFACSAEPLILSLSTMVRLLCCSDNVRKRKKLPGGSYCPPIRRSKTSARPASLFLHFFICLGFRLGFFRRGHCLGLLFLRLGHRRRLVGLGFRLRFLLRGRLSLHSIQRNCGDKRRRHQSG